MGVVGFKILCFYMPLMFLGYYCFSSIPELKRFLCLLFALSVPVSIFALWQYSVGAEALTMFGSGFSIAVVSTPGSAFGEHLRAIGTFSASNLLAIYESCIISLSIILLGLLKTNVSRGVLIGGLVLSVMALMVSGTRGAMLGTVLIVVLMLLLMRNRVGFVGFMVVTAGAIVFIAAVLGEAFLGRLESLLDPASYSGRITGPLLRVLGTLSVAPLGCGLGYASVGARHVMPEGRVMIMAEDYLTKLAFEMGWFGVCAFFWLIIAAFMQGLAVYKASRTREKKWISTGLGVFIVGQLLLSLEGCGLDAIPLNVYFWFFLGVMLKVPQMHDQNVIPPGQTLGMPAVPDSIRGET
jgi:hypothetical protein